MQSVDLMPPELRWRRFMLDRLRIWGTLLGVLVALLAGSGYAMRTGVRQAAAQLADQESIARRLAALKQEIATVQQRGQTILARQSFMKDLIQTKNRERILRTLTTAAGDGVWYQSVELLTDTQSASRPAQRRTTGPKVRIAGFAVSNVEFADLLSRLTATDTVLGVEPIKVQMGRLLGAPMLEFMVDCTLNESKPDLGPRADRNRTNTPIG